MIAKVQIDTGNLVFGGAGFLIGLCFAMLLTNASGQDDMAPVTNDILVRLPVHTATLTVPKVEKEISPKTQDEPVVDLDEKAADGAQAPQSVAAKGTSAEPSTPAVSDTSQSSEAAIANAIKPAAAPNQKTEPEPTPVEEVLPSYGLHLASFGSKDSVATAIAALELDFADAFSETEFQEIESENPTTGRRFIRLVSTGYETRQAAATACEQLKATGQYCAVIELDG